MDEEQKVNCPVCGYVCFPGLCENLACYANPSMPEPVKEKRRQENVQRQAEKEELERLRRIRNAVYGGEKINRGFKP